MNKINSEMILSNSVPRIIDKNNLIDTETEKFVKKDMI